MYMLLKNKTIINSTIKAKLKENKKNKETKNGVFIVHKNAILGFPPDVRSPKPEAKNFHMIV